MVLGGARPPPQSRKEQISPLVGSQKIMEAPPKAMVSEEVQPSKLVFAAARAAREVRARMVERILMVVDGKVDGMKWLNLNGCW